MKDLDYETLDEDARGILRQNDRGGFTIPTSGLYPFQWNWDSVFAAWGFSTFDLPRAWAEIEALFEGQLPSGMVPHIIFRKDDSDYFPGPGVWGCDLGAFSSSGITQPPVAATFIRKLYEQDPALGRPILETLVPKLYAWHQWFMDWRCSDDGAIFVTHPWESGRDNSPDWDSSMAALEPGDVGPYTRRDTSHVDPSMRPTKAEYDRYLYLVQRGRKLGWDDAAMAEAPEFQVAEPGISFILLRANRDLAALCDAVGRDASDVNAWTARIETGCKTLWNDEIGGYDAVNLLTGARSGALSSVAFLCWYAGMPDARMQAPLTRVLSDVAFPVPSLVPQDARFDSLRYWRGPTWGFVNSMIGLGLAESGLTSEAETLRQRTAEVIRKGGFAEYFDPITGAPAGGDSFTWTAAIWLAWVRAGSEG